MQCRPGELVRSGKLAFLHVEVALQSRSVGISLRADLFDHHVAVRVGGGADLEGEVAHVGALGAGDPARQLAIAELGNGVDLLRGSPLLVDDLTAQPAVVLHAAQRAIDLLVSGAVEVADRPVEPVGQLVAGAALFGKG
ncbi:Uncharacterised protein [Mycobacteroides abscessus]|nr:Uncharacterised protein [Mycobacteroides abscessus]